MKKVVIFDFDGCLVHTLDAWMISAHEMLAKRGIFITDEEIVDNVFKSDYGPEAVGVKDIHEFWKEHIANYQSKGDKIYVHEGVLETLDKLRKHGVVNTILTRTEKKSVDLVFERHPELEALIDRVVAREEIENQKPHPEGIHKIMDMYGVDKDHVFTVGDSEHDIVAGKAAGTKTVLFYPTHNEAFYSFEKIHGLQADHTIRNFLDLVDIVI